MIDHAKCRVRNCGGTGRRFEDDCGASQIVCLKCGAAGPRRNNPKGPRRGRPLGSAKAWQGWDELMRPAIPEPLRKLVRAVRRLKLACGYVGSMGKRSRVVARSECIYALEALPPDVLTACLKETDR